MEYDFSAYPKDFPKATPAYFQAIKDKVQALVSGGQLGILLQTGGIIQIIKFFLQKYI